MLRTNVLLLEFVGIFLIVFWKGFEKWLLRECLNFILHLLIVHFWLWCFAHGHTLSSWTMYILVSCILLFSLFYFLILFKTLSTKVVTYTKVYTSAIKMLLFFSFLCLLLYLILIQDEDPFALYHCPQDRLSLDLVFRLHQSRMVYFSRQSYGKLQFIF